MSLGRAQQIITGSGLGQDMSHRRIEDGIVCIVKHTAHDPHQSQKHTVCTIYRNSANWRIVPGSPRRIRVCCSGVLCSLGLSGCCCREFAELFILRVHSVLQCDLPMYIARLDYRQLRCTQNTGELLSLRLLVFHAHLQLRIPFLFWTSTGVYRVCTLLGGYVFVFA